MTVVVERDEVGRENPQVWDVGVTVRASAFEGTKGRQRTLAPGERVSVTIPFTTVRDDDWAPRERVAAVAQVLRGNTEVGQATATATLVPVKAGRDC